MSNIGITREKIVAEVARSRDECLNVLAERPIDVGTVLKENARWNIATYHLRRAIGFRSAREELWIETAVANSWRGKIYNISVMNTLDYPIDRPKDNMNENL